MPGYIAGSFPSLLSVMVDEMKGGFSSSPSLFLYLLWIVFVADGNVRLSPDSRNMAVMALSSFGDASNRTLNRTRNGIVWGAIAKNDI